MRITIDESGDVRSNPPQPRQWRFTAFGRAPFPDPRDDELDQFVDGVERGGALTRMVLIEDAARRIGVQLPPLIEDAADVVGHPGGVHLVRWLARRPEDRTLESTGYEARSDGSGFRYEYTA